MPGMTDSDRSLVVADSFCMFLFSLHHLISMDVAANSTLDTEVSGLHPTVG